VTESAHKFICSGRDFDILCSNRREVVFHEFSIDAVGSWDIAAEKVMPNQKIGPRYRADITAGSLKVTESRRIADLLLQKVDADDEADRRRNIYLARPCTIRQRCVCRHSVRSD
jgi:hypothetical protein